MKKFYYTIGEVSNLLGVKTHVIRFWESEFAALRPKKGEGRIRKYSEHHIELLKKIQDLLHNQRFTIEGARQKLKQERTLIHAIAEDAEPEQLSLDLGDEVTVAAAPSAKRNSATAKANENLYNLLSGVRSELCRMKNICNQHNRK